MHASAGIQVCMAQVLETEKQKMLAGELYDASDALLVQERSDAQARMHQYNAATPDEQQRLLATMLAECGQNVTARAPFHFDYGYNIRLADNVFLNYGCVLLDVNTIHIGEGTQIGPAVQIYTADHPRDAVLRGRGLECGKPVTIGSNVWIGGGAILLPGVTVHDDAIVGAGSVVTRDVAAGTTVAGNPARPLPRPLHRGKATAPGSLAPHPE